MSRMRGGALFPFPDTILLFVN